jgi:D-tagatose-1,6-bisphosphate aldolase subunit GatZ/KbaZ
MLRRPVHWEQHYRGDKESLRLKLRYSYSDRCRYYLPAPAVREAVDRLLANLRAATIPPSLVSQYLPRQYARLREGALPAEPSTLLRDHVGDCVDDYLLATAGQGACDCE